MPNILQTQKLTPKQRKWIEVYEQTLNATEAAMQAYNCKDRVSGKAIGAENLAKLNFECLMDVIGLSEENLLKRTNEGLNATKPIIKDGRTVAIPDHAVRHKYIETAFKLRGKLSNKVELTGKDGEELVIKIVEDTSLKDVVEGEVVESDNATNRTSD